MSASERVASMSPEELIAAIERGLKADEQAAREAANRRWLVEDNTISLWPERDDDGFMSFPTRADARHAYRHDPSRVLAEVQAKRRLIELITAQRKATVSMDEYQRARAEAFADEMLLTLARPYLTQETP